MAEDTSAGIGAEVDVDNKPEVTAPESETAAVAAVPVANETSESEVTRSYLHLYKVKHIFCTLCMKSTNTSSKLYFSRPWFMALNVLTIFASLPLFPFVLSFGIKAQEGGCL